MIIARIPQSSNRDVAQIRFVFSLSEPGELSRFRRPRALNNGRGAGSRKKASWVQAGTTVHPVSASAQAQSALCRTASALAYPQNLWTTLFACHEALEISGARLDCLCGRQPYPFQGIAPAEQLACFPAAAAVSIP